MQKLRLRSDVCAYIPKALAKWGERTESLILNEPDNFADAYRHLTLDFQNMLAKMYPETARGRKTEILTPYGSFSYSYQRVNLEWQGKNWLGLIHGRSAAEFVQAGGFKRSGMAAVESILTFIDDCGLNMQVSPEPYYETLFKMRRMDGVRQVDIAANSFDKDAEVLFLDTSSRSWPELPAERGNVKLVVVDTACIEAGHELVDKTYIGAKRLGIGVVLIRSHMKLDCFGLDINTLGSVIALMPERASQEVRDLMKNYMERITDTNRCDDSARLRDLYPWLGAEPGDSMPYDHVIAPLPRAVSLHGHQTAKTKTTDELRWMSPVHADYGTPDRSWGGQYHHR